MKRLRVDYFLPGQEFEGRPLFKYVLVADEKPVNGRITVEISSLDPAGHPNAFNGQRTIVTEDVEIALTGVQAILNSHHDKLKDVAALVD